MTKTTEQRIDNLETGHMFLSQQMDENTKLTRQVAEDTKDLVEMAKNAQGAIKVLEFLAKGLKFIAWTSFYTGLIWAAYSSFKIGITTFLKAL